MSVEEIEAAIERLPKSELADLASWFADFQAGEWENQIEQDLESGRLDGWLAQVEQEYSLNSACANRD